MQYGRSRCMAVNASRSDGGGGAVTKSVIDNHRGIAFFGAAPSIPRLVE